MRYRHSLLLLLALLACSQELPPLDYQKGYVFAAYGFSWRYEKSMPVCTSYSWTQRDPVDVQRICQGTHYTTYLGCVLQSTCAIISMYDEETAKIVHPETGQSHWAHERWHVEKQLVHP